MNDNHWTGKDVDNSEKEQKKYLEQKIKELDTKEIIVQKELKNIIKSVNNVINASVDSKGNYTPVFGLDFLNGMKFNMQKLINNSSLL